MYYTTLTGAEMASIEANKRNLDNLRMQQQRSMAAIETNCTVPPTIQSEGSLDHDKMASAVADGTGWQNIKKSININK